MRVDAGGVDTNDSFRTAARDGEVPAGRWAVQGYISVRVPASKAVSSKISKRMKVRSIEGNTALRLCGVARLQLGPFLCDLGTCGLDPRIKGLFHARLLLLEQRKPRLDPLERKIPQIQRLWREAFPGAMRRQQVSRNQVAFL